MTGSSGNGSQPNEDATVIRPQMPRPGAPTHGAGASPPWAGGGQPTPPWSQPGGTSGWTDVNAPPLPPPAPPAPAPRRPSPALLVACVAVAVLVAAAGVLVYNQFNRSSSTSPSTAQPSEDTPAAPAPSSTSATPGPEEQTVDPAAIKNLLLSTDKLNHMLYTQGLAVAEEGNNAGDEAQPANCVGVYGPLEKGSYDGSGYSASIAQVIEHADGQPRERKAVMQGVAAFPGSAEAKRFFDAETARWNQCARSDVSVGTTAGQTLVMRVFGVEAAEGMTTIEWVRTGGTGWGCGRGLAVRRNVAIDVRVCDYAGSPLRIDELVDAIAKRVTSK